MSIKEFISDKWQLLTQENRWKTIAIVEFLVLVYLVFNG